VADEELDGTDMVFYLLGEGQRRADEARKALPQGVVEPCDMIGFPGLLRDGFVALCRNDAIVHFILVRVKYGVFLIDLGELACHFTNLVGSWPLLVICHSGISWHLAWLYFIYLHTHA
jgi:hypothetical protein